MLKYRGVKKIKIKKSTGTYLAREEMEQRARVCVCGHLAVGIPSSWCSTRGGKYRIPAKQSTWGVKHGLVLGHVRLHRWKSVTSGAFLFSSIVSASWYYLTLHCSWITKDFYQIDHACTPSLSVVYVLCITRAKRISVPSSWAARKFN